MRRPRPTLARLSGAARGRCALSVSLPPPSLGCSAPGAGSAPKSNPPWRVPPLAFCASPAAGRRAAGAMVRPWAGLPSPLPSQCIGRRDPDPVQLQGLVPTPGPHTEGPPGRRRGHPALSRHSGAALSACTPTPFLRRRSGKLRRQARTPAPCAPYPRLSPQQVRLKHAKHSRVWP